MDFHRILVPIDRNVASLDAFKIACALAKSYKGEVIALYVIEVMRSLPLEAEMEPEIAKGEDLLSQAENIAGDRDVKVETDLLQAREVGSAVVDEAAERKADLILIGLPYKKHFGEFSLGRAVPYLLKNAPCAVMVLREKLPEEDSDLG